jgi:hypothetical protein
MYRMMIGWMSSMLFYIDVTCYIWSFFFLSLDYQHCLYYSVNMETTKPNTTSPTSGQTVVKKSMKEMTRKERRELQVNINKII